MPQKTTVIEQTIFLPVKPVMVYDAFLDEEKHSEFTGARATCSRAVGGLFTAYDGYISGEIIELEHPRKIVQSWKTIEWPEGYEPSRLTLTLAPKDEGCEITMVHAMVPAPQAEQYRKGWNDYYWEPLKKYFARKH